MDVLSVGRQDGGHVALRMHVLRHIGAVHFIEKGLKGILLLNSTHIPT